MIIAKWCACQGQQQQLSTHSPAPCYRRREKVIASANKSPFWSRLTFVIRLHSQCTFLVPPYIIDVPFLPLVETLSLSPRKALATLLKPNKVRAEQKSPKGIECRS